MDDFDFSGFRAFDQAKKDSPNGLVTVEVVEIGQANMGPAMIFHNVESWPHAVKLIHKAKFRLMRKYGCVTCSAFNDTNEVFVSVYKRK